MKNTKKVLIMAGGTGGHIIPGLAIANKLQEDNPDISIQWLGTKKGLENKLVSQEKIKLNYISVWGLRNKSILVKLLAPFRLSYATLQSIFIMLKYRPDAVLGMGGFVCGPGGLAAFLTCRKLYIHEQNAVAGFTNTVLARMSKKVFESFPNSFHKINSKIKNKLIYTGNPVRKDILNLKRLEKDPQEFNLLIIGGSRGAVALNKLIPVVINNLINNSDLKHKINITHQCGELNYKSTLEIYKKYNLDNNPNISLIKYIDNIVDYYAKSDLVICRAGAMTVSELAVAKIPAIFIPFPHAVDDHQTKNAEFLANNDAAVIMQQKNLTADSLANKIIELVNTDEKLQSMSEKASNISNSNALDIISKSILI